MVDAVPELDILIHLGSPQETRQAWRSTLISAALHLIVAAILMNVKFDFTPAPPSNFPLVTARRVTPLVAPPPQVIRELTQKAPNKSEVAKELDLEGLMPRPEARKSLPARAALSPRPQPGVPVAPSLPSAPKIEVPDTPAPQLPPAGLANSNLPPPPGPQPPPEKPKLAFENVPGTGRSTGNTQGSTAANAPKFQIPRGTVDEAVSAAVRNRPGGGMVVGDEMEPPSISQSMSQLPAPGRMGSQLELLSDPQGADFRPYLIRVLAAVRRNWFAVIPESVRLGQRRGRVVIQFAISRNGNVPKLVIATPSGAEPLDRAAVAGISASNPFPPLPPDFKGDQIRLQLSFSYNNQQR